MTTSNIGVVIPARNESANLPIVIGDLMDRVQEDPHARQVDIVVCDNGSSDATAAVASELGALVVHEAVAGYGIACQRAIAALPAVDLVVFVDADQRVTQAEWHGLLDAIESGADLAVGVRHLSDQGAMTPQQAWGNRFATSIIRTLFRYPVSDLGPFRAIRSHCLATLNMQDKAYGWTVEMQLKAHLCGFRVEEVPVRARRREHGRSMISGTLRGTLGAGIGILGTIVRSTGWSLQQKRQTT